MHNCATVNFSRRYLFREAGAQNYNDEMLYIWAFLCGSNVNFLLNKKRHVQNDRCCIRNSFLIVLLLMDMNEMKVLWGQNVSFNGTFTIDFYNTTAISSSTHWRRRPSCKLPKQFCRVRFQHWLSGLNNDICYLPQTSILRNDQVDIIKFWPVYYWVLKQTWRCQPVPAHEFSLPYLPLCV